MSESRDAIAFRELCIRWLDGLLATDEAVQLERVLLDDPSAVDEFLCAADLHAELFIRGAGDRAAWQSPDRLARQTEASRAAARRTRIARTALIAAALVLAAATIAIYVFVIDRPTEQPTTRSQNPIATLIESTGTLLVNDDLAYEGSDYTSGTYSLDHGTAEFMLTNAVNVKLRGKTSMVMHNDLDVSLDHGSAEFVVPHGAEGFTVHLPGGARVIDLGTRFEVDIDGHEQSVRVIEGEVEVHHAERVIRLDPHRAARLVQGEWDVIVAPAGHARIEFAAADFTEAAQLSTTGNLVEAINFGNSTPVPPIVVNGIAFISANKTSDHLTPTTPVTATIDGLKYRARLPLPSDRHPRGLTVEDADALFDSSVDSLSGGPTSVNNIVTLRGLTPGRAYEFQLLLVDDRIVSNVKDRTVTAQEVDGEDTTGPLDNTSNYIQLVTGSFIANAPQQQFRLMQTGAGSTGMMCLNAYQLRDVTPNQSPESPIEAGTPFNQPPKGD